MRGRIGRMFGLAFVRVVRLAHAPIARLGHARDSGGTVALLDGVRHFMREEVIARRGAGLVLSRAEIHVLSGGERFRLDGCGRAVGGGIGVDSNTTQAGTEGRFEPVPVSFGQWLCGTRLQGRIDSRGR